MKPTARLIAITALAAGLAAAGPAQSAPSDPPREIPASLQVQLGEILARLALLAEQPTPVGIQAGRLHALLASHMAYLEEVILPPLTLLPTLVATDVTPAMKWALPLVERAKAEQGQQAQVQMQLTDQMVELFTAARETGDTQAGKLAQDIATYQQGETEVIAPATQLVGKYLRLRFASGS